MTIGQRLEAIGVIALVLGGLLLGAAAAVGFVGVEPPAIIAPVLAALLAGVTAVKVAAIGSGLVAFARGAVRTAGR